MSPKVTRIARLNYLLLANYYLLAHYNQTLKITLYENHDHNKT